MAVIVLSDTESETESDTELESDVELVSDDELEYIVTADEKVAHLTCTLVNLNVPAWYINPTFKTVIPDRDAFDDLTAVCPLTYPPTLGDVLNAAGPPRFSYFATLPKPKKGFWAIYAVSMVKEGEKSCLYFGSGTDASTGVTNRTGQYFPGSLMLPRFVNRALNEGYTISHIGMICWTPIPSPGFVPRSRGLFLALEAVFTVVFHACNPMITDSYLDDVQLWPRESVEWEPLCSHLLLNEGIIGDLTLSPEQLEEIAEARRVRRNARHQLSRDRQRAEDPKAYAANERKTKNDWNDKHRVRSNKTARQSHRKAQDAKRFSCDDCQLPLASEKSLEVHKKTQGHKDKVNGVTKAAPTAEYTKFYKAVKSSISKAKAAKKYFCKTCDLACESSTHLRNHKEGVRHINRQNKLDAAASAST